MMPKVFESMSASRAARATADARLGLGMIMTTIITTTTLRGASG